jgi:hypothetical protein
LAQEEALMHQAAELRREKDAALDRVATLAELEMEKLKVRDRVLLRPTSYRKAQTQRGVVRSHNSGRRSGAGHTQIQQAVVRETIGQKVCCADAVLLTCL